MMRHLVLLALMGTVLTTTSGCVGGHYASHPELAYRSLDRGEAVKSNLSEPVKLAGSPAQLKVVGLQQARNLADLGNDASKSAQKYKGGTLGKLMGEVADTAGEAQQDLVLTVVVAGAEADKGSGQIAHVYKPAQTTGSIFDFKIGNKMKATVTATGFKPKVLFLEKYDDRSTMSKMGSPTTSTPQYRIVQETKGEPLIPGQVSAIYTAGKTAADADQGGGIVIMVTSEDGTGMTGEYTLKFEVL